MTSFSEQIGEAFDRTWHDARRTDALLGNLAPPVARKINEMEPP
jgi:hypothetical protein